MSLILTLTNEQRLGLTGILNNQPAKKMKDFAVHYELFKKVRLADIVEDNCLVRNSFGGLKMNRAVSDQTSEIEFAKDEVRTIVDLLNTTEMPVASVGWAQPLLAVCTDALLSPALQ